IKKRRQAFQQHHEIEDAMLAIVPVAVDLLDEAADVSRIIEACETAAEHYSRPIRMVVFDTLSRVMAGGNENSPEDMTAVISNIDKVRHATRAHTLIVHHSGKNAAQGARGHSSLRAATDTEIEISKTGENFAVAKIRKQRDLEQAGDMGFRLEKMLVGINKRGKELSSCVVLPVELDGSETVRLTPTEKRLFDIIANIFADETRIRQKAYLEFPGSAKIAVSDACPKSDIRTWFLREVGQTGHENRTLEGSSEKEVTNASRNFLRALNSLKEKGKIMYDGQLVSVPELRVQ
ncbi:MAG: AAA family ATPase, partial [Pseudomonadota bacterium]|nr:AAA family ATPase [Pseudomonadota bacterium]